MSSASNYSDYSLSDLFRLEADTQSQVLTAGLLALERNPTAPDQLETVMRASHSIKGAARIVNFDVVVRLAHAMEDYFVAAQRGRTTLQRPQIDLFLQAVDLIGQISKTPDSNINQWNSHPDVARIIEQIARALAEQPIPSPTPAPQPEPISTPKADSPIPPASIPTPPRPTPPPNPSPEPVPSANSIPLPAPLATPPDSIRSFGKNSSAIARPDPQVSLPSTELSDRVLRVTAEHLNRLLGLAGESLVESRWLSPFTDSLLRLKRHHYDLVKSLDGLRDAIASIETGPAVEGKLADARSRVAECRKFLSERLLELEMFDRRSANLSHRLYSEALACRMRPFADGIQHFPRMVRDLSHSLGKTTHFEILGRETQVDRDILEKLEAPLTHLLRNAVDHGIELPNAREQSGKPPEGHLTLEARHSAGMLVITVSDDGAGIHLEKLRDIIVSRNLTDRPTADKLSENELLDFLFLPGFSLKSGVTEISGRGVGLDVVQNMVKEVRGTIRITTQHGKGTRFILQLPLTLSVMRTLLVELAGEPYAFPLAYLSRSVKFPRENLESIEGQHHFDMAGEHVGVVTLHQILGKPQPALPDHQDVSIVVIGDRNNRYGLVVDRFLGERELVVHPLDPRLGKIKDIAAGALMEDGSPVLIFDVHDLIRSIEKLLRHDRITTVHTQALAEGTTKRKRILVVEDSLTVRELERKLLDQRGYQVDIAVDGMEGWNALRTSHFDLVVTDVDMPRMDGIELVTLIKKDPHLKDIPVLIVSYKDREEDRRRGLEAGADYYLTKGSFHDETLIQAVTDLIGQA